MCGLRADTWGEESDCLEGWLRKKSHHLGVWKWRYFRFDGRILRYWASERRAMNDLAPRMHFTLAGCHVVANQELRLILRAPRLPFDEELEAPSSDLRDQWVRCLNAAALKHRRSIVCQVPGGSERFLKAKGLWRPLLEAAMRSLQGGQDVKEMLLAHVCFGSVLMRLNDEWAEPRQGTLVVNGRRMLRCIAPRRCSHGSGMLQDKELQLRGDSLARPSISPPEGSPSLTEAWLLLLSARAMEEPGSAGRLWGQKEALQEPTDLNHAFDVLHAFADPLDDTKAQRSLPMRQCDVSHAFFCEDGSGWGLTLKSEETSSPQCETWNLTFRTREECEGWRKSILASIWSVRAKASGRQRTPEEALATFDASPNAWISAAAQRLEQVAEDAPKLPEFKTAASWASPPMQRLRLQPKSPPRPEASQPADSSVASSGSTSSAPGMLAAASLRRVLNACSEVCTEAECLLEAALSSRPLRRDAAGAAVTSGFVPALATLGRCWAKVSSDLPHGDGPRALLRWLEERRLSLQRLGAVWPALDRAAAGIASELSLRTGLHLRRIAAQLLFHELRERFQLGSSIGSSSGGALAASSSACRESDSAGNLAVDFFTMVYSCLGFERDPDLLLLRLASQRVAKFLVWQVQEALLNWTFASLPQVPRDIRPADSSTAAASTGTTLTSEASTAMGVPPLTLKWLEAVSALVNSVPIFQSQCRELSRLPLRSSGDGERGETQAQEDKAIEVTSSFDEGPEIVVNVGQNALPDCFNFDDEVTRFEYLRTCLLWAAADVVSTRWRRIVLRPATIASDSSAAIEVAVRSGGVRGLLKSTLDPALQFMRQLLSHSSDFEALLRKLFHICVGCYIVRLSRGLWFQADSPDMQLFRLSEDTAGLCSFFREKSPSMEVESGCLWEPGRVLNMLHAVLAASGSIATSSPTSRSRNQITSPRTPPMSPPRSRSGSSLFVGWESALSKLVAVLSEKPLPIQEVALWFGPAGVVPATCFEELPLEVGPGGTSISPDGTTAAQRKRQSSSNESWSGSCGPERRRSMPGISPFGSGSSSRPPSKEFRTTDSEKTTECPAPLGLASDGALFALRVEESGAYGAFCEVHCRIEAVAGGSTPSRGCRKRRWAQLTRDSPTEAAALHLLSGSPETASSDVRPRTLAKLPLTALAEVRLMSNTSIDLLFRTTGSKGPGPSRASEENYEASGAVAAGRLRCSLRFDCPSVVFRWKLVLESWWSKESIQGLTFPIVVLRGSTVPGGDVSETLLEGGWKDLPGPLTRQVLSSQLGDLWLDVKARLEGGSTLPTKPSSGYWARGS